MKNWTSYRRMQVNVDKAKHNNTVNTLLTRHYTQLHKKLVKKSADEDIFNDTFLKMTYCYSPDKDFTEQFTYYFNLLRGAYYRDNKSSPVKSYSTIPDYLAVHVEETELEQPTISLEELTNKVKTYANTAKATKKATKEG